MCEATRNGQPGRSAGDERLVIHDVDGYAGVQSRVRLSQGERLLPLSGVISSRPTRYSLQVGPAQHLEPSTNGEASVERAAWRFVNHGCAPCLRVDVEERVFVAVRTIEAGEELTFDYNTTEWSMATPFRCSCGASTCVGRVAGFSRLATERQAALLPHAAPHIRTLYEAAQCV